MGIRNQNLMQTDRLVGFSNDDPVRKTWLCQ